MTRWTAGWILWLLWFLFEELLAISYGGWQATLSGHVWMAFAIKDAQGRDLRERTTAWRLRRFLLLGFMAWLTVHLISGGYV